MKNTYLYQFPFLIFFLFVLNKAYSQNDSTLLGQGLQKDSLIIDSLPQRALTTTYLRPKPFGFVTNVPSDLLQTAKYPFKKKNLLTDGLVVGSTLLLIAFDQQITDGTVHFARQLGISNDTKYCNALSIKTGNTKTSLFKIPKNGPSLFYTIGQGWVGVLMAGGFEISGLINHNYRSRQTASDLVEGFISSGISTQIIKRISGRESPFVATKPGGAWRPFPSFSDYQQNTECYDAFPSGHLTSMITTVCILAENYPEKKWIRPLGYTLASLSGLAMVNLKVHWISDFPLAILLGHINGKVITARHKKKVARSNFL